MQILFRQPRMDCFCRHATTTPSGFACHPSTGGECTNADTFSTTNGLFLQTRHNHPVTPLHLMQTLFQQPQMDCFCRHATTTPSGFACHPSTGGECTNADTFSTTSNGLFLQTRHNHPVRLRLPPLHRRGMY